MLRSHPWTQITSLVVILGVASNGYAQGESGSEASSGETSKDTTPEPFPASWHWASNQKQLDGCYKLVGKKAPSLATQGWLNSTPTADDLRGKIIVVDFWSTWCRPCIQAIPHTNEIMEKYADAGVRVIGVCGSRGSEKMVEIARKYDMRYPTTKDIYNQTAVGWGVQWQPYYVIMDRQGIIRAAGLHPNYVEKAVQALIEEQPAAAAVEAPEGEDDSHEHAGDDADTEGAERDQTDSPD